MSARQIDESLSLWKARLDAAAQNILDVQSHPVYKRLSAPDSKLSGETAEKAALAVRTLSWLLQFFDLLQGVIARAEELRRDMPTIFGADEREREIAALLAGRSIQLPPAQIPLGQRSLSGGGQQPNALTPAELLSTMETAFEEVKQIVLRVDASWEALGRSVEEAAQRLAALQQASTDLDTADRLALGQAEQRLQSAGQLATSDPLGTAPQVVANITESLHRIGVKLQQSQRERAQLRSDLASAKQLFESLKSEHQVARALCAEASEKTGFSLDLCAGDQRLEGLANWLGRLQAAVPESAPASITVGLRNWTGAAGQALAAERDALQQAKAQLAQRLELRGRLEALKAKARAYSLAENDSLLAIAERAKEMLYKRPTPLREAASSVAEYEAQLNSWTAKLV